MTPHGRRALAVLAGSAALALVAYLLSPANFGATLLLFALALPAAASALAIAGAELTRPGHGSRIRPIHAFLVTGGCIAYLAFIATPGPLLRLVAAVIAFLIGGLGAAIAVWISRGYT